VRSLESNNLLLLQAPRAHRRHAPMAQLCPTCCLGHTKSHCWRQETDALLHNVPGSWSSCSFAPCKLATYSMQNSAL
jgi:hypothetical protein